MSISQLSRVGKEKEKPKEKAKEAKAKDKDPPREKPKETERERPDKPQQPQAGIMYRCAGVHMHVTCCACVFPYL